MTLANNMNRPLARLNRPDAVPFDSVALAGRKWAARMHCVQSRAAQGFRANEDPYALVGLMTCQLGKPPPPRALLLES
jgi:hypothetical protein